jgi:DNA-binding beta-propeller fold protein YncE
MQCPIRTRALIAIAAALLSGSAAYAQLAVSANDGKVTLENGVTKVVPNPPSDTISVIDLSVSPPKLVSEIEAPGSVVGPPMSVAVAPDESFALVTAAMKVDPADPTKMAPDDRLSVIDLKSSPPKIVDTVKTGKGPAGVSINRAGTLALVANRSEGTVSVYRISGGKLTDAGKIPLGDDKSGPSQPVFTRDGTMALVSRDGDHKISVLTVDGDKVEYAKRDVNAGLRPYAMDMGPDIAIVGNIGIGGGDADTISIIDVKIKPARVVNTISVGQTPEGLKVSPDGQHVAVTVMNGTNKPKNSPFFNEAGLLHIYRIDGHNLAKVAESKIGTWCQGIAWSNDSKTLVAQCTHDRNVTAFRFDGKNLEKLTTIAVEGGPSGIRTAEP